MTVDPADSPSLEELSYRELQTKLKAHGLPAKGPHPVLRDRLAEAIAEGRIPPETDLPLSSPPSLPKASPKASPTARKRKAAQDTKSPKTERFVVTTEIRGEHDTKWQSRQILSASKAALPEANVRIKRISKVQSPGTPLERMKKIATDSAIKLQDSASKLQKRLEKQKLGKWWPALLLAALILLAGGLSAVRGPRSWQRQFSRQMDGMQNSLSNLYETSHHQAAWLRNSLNQGIAHSTGRLWNAGSTYAEDTYDKALSYLPSTKKLRANLPTSACSARLNATVLNDLLPRGHDWSGLQYSLEDAWKGLKDDPLKGTGVLMAGDSQSSLTRAAFAIEAAVPKDCRSCFLHLRGDEMSEGGTHATGQLQLRMYRHLLQCPSAIVHVQNIAHVHADMLTVFLSVMSEQGGLTVNGKTIPAHRAIYIGSLVAPKPVMALADEQAFAAAVKRDMILQFEFRADPTQAYVAEVFRRRWDYVMPLDSW